MPFSEKIKEDAMIACGRSCCICHKFCGNKMEVHHIKTQRDGGDDTFDNAIPLCFDCHAEVKSYNPHHPKGIKFTDSELKRHRDEWYSQVKKGKKDNEEIPPLKILRQKGFEKLKLTFVKTGRELLNIVGDCYGMYFHNDEPQTREEATIISEFHKEIEYLLDAESLMEASEKVMVGFDLNELIENLDKKGFWIFAAKELQILTGGVKKSPESFPMGHVWIAKKDNPNIKLKTEI